MAPGRPLVSWASTVVCDAWRRGHLVLVSHTAPCFHGWVKIQGRGAVPAACTAGGWDGVAGLPCARGGQSGPGVGRMPPRLSCYCSMGSSGEQRFGASQSRSGQAVRMALTLYRVKGCLLHIPPNWKLPIFFSFFFFLAMPRGFAGP